METVGMIVSVYTAIGGEVLWIARHTAWWLAYRINRKGNTR